MMEQLALQSAFHSQHHKCTGSLALCAEKQGSQAQLCRVSSAVDLRYDSHWAWASLLKGHKTHNPASSAHL